jgi:hypothetical protein
MHHATVNHQTRRELSLKARELSNSLIGKRAKGTQKGALMKRSFSKVRKFFAGTCAIALLFAALPMMPAQASDSGGVCNHTYSPLQGQFLGVQYVPHTVKIDYVEIYCIQSCYMYDYVRVCTQCLAVEGPHFSAPQTIQHSRSHPGYTG